MKTIVTVALLITGAIFLTSCGDVYEVYKEESQLDFTPPSPVDAQIEEQDFSIVRISEDGSLTLNGVDVSHQNLEFELEKLPEGQRKNTILSVHPSTRNGDVLEIKDIFVDAGSKVSIVLEPE